MKGRILIAGPAKGRIEGELKVPGDKSISHRLMMLGALATGMTRVRGFLAGEDNLATVRMFSRMGVRTEWLNAEKTVMRIHGVGIHGLREPVNVLDAGNSGTGARLMAGILAGQPFFSVMTGDASLCKRPMSRVTKPLRMMGAHMDGREGGSRLPLSVRGGSLNAIQYRTKVASAQVKSCLLLAGLFADGQSEISEPGKSRDHTERLLPIFGQPIDLRGRTICISPAGRLQAPDSEMEIPADPSAASFFAVGACLVPGSEVRLSQVGINPRRDGWRRILSKMGARLDLEKESRLGLEPMADIMVHSRCLRGIEVAREDVVDAIDEFPILFVAAALSEGEFVLDGASELRAKESDRIATIATALRQMGADLETRQDGIRIRGREQLRGGVRIDAAHDHRIAMAMSIAAQRADSSIEILHAETISTSFPDFVPMAQSLGLNIYWQ